MNCDFKDVRSATAKGLQQSSPGRPTKAGECVTPRLKKGRRPMEEMLQDNQSPPHSPPPPPPVLPPAPFRRPRGRPRSNPLPDQTQGATATPTHSGNSDSSVGKKRRRCWNRKYRNGEYIVERKQAKAETEEKCVTTRQAARAEAGTDSTGFKTGTLLDESGRDCPSIFLRLYPYIWIFLTCTAMLLNN